MVLFWVVILATSVLLYVLLDGFDLGVGILFGASPDEKSRQDMLGAVAPVWDGNETWLVSAGVVLWGAFPLVYSTLISAFYLPVLLMLAGLILRGVAFEFRYKTERARWIWDIGFCCGSTVAAFMQGMMVGALVEGLPMSGSRYIGGELGWLSPFSVISGVGLCFGYTLLGACWLVQKCEGDVRQQARGSIVYLAGGLLAFFVFLFFYALSVDLKVLTSWLDRPYFLLVPGVGIAAAFVLAVTVRHQRDDVPFYVASTVFAAAFLTLAISFWPYMIPFSIRIEDAAAPASSLAFMFWAGVFVFPLMLLYTVINYIVFRGRVKPSAEHY